MTDISKEVVTHSAATCLLLDGQFVKEADYRAACARIAELEAAERKSRGYRVGHIAGYHAAIREAADRAMPDDPSCKCDICVALVQRSKAILALIDKEPT